MRRRTFISAIPATLAACAVGFGKSGAAEAPRVIEYRLPRANAFPHDPALAPDGMVWYADQATSHVGRLDPASGAVVDVATPTPNAGPHGITVAPDGMVWFTENSAGRIGRLDPAHMTIREFTLPPEIRDPHTLLVIDGKVWFDAQGSNYYGVLDPAAGHADVHKIDIDHALPYGMALAPDRSLWIALFGTNRLGRVTLATQTMREFSLPNAGARPRRITIDSHGAVWYTDYPR
ncbi:MAG: hypothetical protein JO043_08485, partial [Candidatus Eremiobacteraeota bacterium]|nr:hypothetical protein [Candidatus Eremiobacteraeota bacterium]